MGCGHEILKCTCGTVVSQCRCASKDKRVRFSRNACAECKKLALDAPLSAEFQALQAKFSPDTRAQGVYCSWRDPAKDNEQLAPPDSPVVDVAGTYPPVVALQIEKVCGDATVRTLTLTDDEAIVVARFVFAKMAGKPLAAPPHSSRPGVPVPQKRYPPVR